MPGTAASGDTGGTARLQAEGQRALHGQLVLSDRDSTSRISATVTIIHAHFLRFDRDLHRRPGGKADHQPRFSGAVVLEIQAALVGRWRRWRRHLRALVVAAVVDRRSEVARSNAIRRRRHIRRIVRKRIDAA